MRHPGHRRNCVKYDTALELMVLTWASWSASVPAPRTTRRAGRRSAQVTATADVSPPRTSTCAEAWMRVAVITDGGCASARTSAKPCVRADAVGIGTLLAGAEESHPEASTGMATPDPNLPAGRASRLAPGDAPRIQLAPHASTALRTSRALRLGAGRGGARHRGSSSTSSW